MKVFYSIALTTIFVSLPVHSSVIVPKNDTLNCDGLICPDGSTSCIVSKKTFGDLSKYKYVRICTDYNGLPTDSKTEELDNPRPGTEMNTISVYEGSKELIEAKQKEIKEEIDKVVQETDDMVQEIAENIRQETENIAQETENIAQETENIAQETENIAQETENIVQETDDIVQETESIVQETKDRVANCMKSATGYVKDTMSYWSNWTSNFFSKMKKMFPPGFPFVK